MTAREMLVETIQQRSLPDGGYASVENGGYRVDATAWAVIALAAGGATGDVLESSCHRLATSQLKDGRVPIVLEHPDSIWPTPLSVLAWRACGGYREECSCATRFLLTHNGKHFKSDPSSPFGHDTSLVGWPWLLDAHSWVGPTALSVMALDAEGYGDHERVQAAAQMLIDRQIPEGGWNYGNTTVFGRTTKPLPDTTGMALCALSGHVQPFRVAASIAYLERETRRIQTPLSLGWALIALASWESFPAESETWIEQTLERQHPLGRYDTESLSVLLLACLVKTGSMRFCRPDIGVGI